ncbi:PIN domain-containing protein [Sphingomonas sp. SUN019]|uniref:PIN domain-containing protein n=1 Tax=Sphingomonas sp. SUN019 TaxID=2937788 RepID=UPI002164A6B4|nr:PIN domain-containing protein [Sphingomonas sp. SUN019]UVO49012.1 PIN domain-containing protein [Sphingomonas sp. SUN019]
MIATFFDSNVILYSTDRDERKAEIADALIGRGGWISVQVLNEIAHVARRKMQLDWDRVTDLIGTITGLTGVIDLTVELHNLGRRVAERYKFSIYDGMIVAAALIADCDTLYSEDMHDGLVIDGRLRIVNPFAPDALTG